MLLATSTRLAKACRIGEMSSNNGTRRGPFHTFLETGHLSDPLVRPSA